jgi:hypothetical protein
MKVFTLYVRGEAADAPIALAEILDDVKKHILDRSEVPYLFTTIVDKHGNDVGRYAVKEQV